MTTKLEQTIEILLKNPANFITDRGVETTMKNGRNEILLSVKGLIPTSQLTEETTSIKTTTTQPDDLTAIEEESAKESADTEALATKTKKKYTKSGSK